MRGGAGEPTAGALDLPQHRVQAAAGGLGGLRLGPGRLALPELQLLAQAGACVFVTHPDTELLSIEELAASIEICACYEVAAAIGSVLGFVNGYALLAQCLLMCCMLEQRRAWAEPAPGNGSPE